MKRISKLLTLTVLTVTMIAATVFAYADEPSFGSEAALADESYTLEEMLTYAIQDEYAAQAEYDAIMEQYGTIRPFSNIIRSETVHISLLLPLFEEYGIEVPVNDAADRTIIPDTLAESYQTGVTAEIKNISMYQSFLEEDLPDDVKAVFERLMAASENHLKAFQNASDRQGGMNGNAGIMKGLWSNR